MSGTAVKFTVLIRNALLCSGAGADHGHKRAEREPGSRPRRAERRAPGGPQGAAAGCGCRQRQAEGQGAADAKAQVTWWTWEPEAEGWLSGLGGWRYAVLRRCGPWQLPAAAGDGMR